MNLQLKGLLPIMACWKRHGAPLKASILFFLLPCLLRAQSDPLEESWRWVKFTTASGLPSNIVRDIKDGPDDTPWAWTSGGLAWFDGYQWHEVDSTRRCVQKGVASIVGFWGNEVVIHVNETYYLANRRGIAPFPLDSVNFILPIGHNAAILKRNKSLFRYADGQLDRFPLPSGDALIRMVLQAGQIRIQTGDIALEGDTTDRMNFSRFDGKGTDFECFSENRIGQGIGLIRSPSSEDGIWEWDRKRKAWHNGFRSVRQGLLAAIADNGDALAVFENNFIRLRRNGAWKTLHLPNFIRDLTQVRYRPNGDLWVATHHGLFLCRLSARHWTFQNWNESDRRNRVNNIIRSRDGTLWLATTGGLVHVLPDGKRISTSSIHGKPIGRVTGLVEDREGNIWISSGSDFPGAYRWEGKTWRFFPIQDGSDGIHVHHIVCDSNGSTWFLCLSGDFLPASRGNPGVYTYDRGVIQRWKESPGLPHQRVYSFAEGKDGALWFGTFGGLACRDGEGWKIWDRASGAVTGPVTCLAVDERNRVWFGMQRYAPGVGMLDNSGMIRYFTVADGLPDDFVWDVKIDSRRRIWVSTQKGIAVFDGAQWRAFDERTGLNDPLIWPILPEDSVVQVGTLNNGLATLHLNEVEWEYPRILINRPVIEHDHVLLEWKTCAWWGSPPPEEILTRYRIDAGDWSEWTTKQSLALDRLPYAEHTLQVQAKGLYGEYDEAGAAMSFRIDPPLQERWYVYLPATAILILIAGLVLLLHRRRALHLRELGESELRYRTITELMSDYAYLYRVGRDAELELVWMTDSFTRVTGYPTREAGAADFMRRVIHPEDLETALQGHRRLLAGERLTMEHRIVTKEGKLRWVERRSAPLCDPAGNRVEYIFGVVSDITPRKESEQRLRSLAGDLVKTEERERRRMATYLHDVIGQTLTLSYLKLHRWQKRNRPDDPVLDEIRATLDQAIRDAHTLTFDLCPPIIYELSLTEALAWLVERLQAQYESAIETEFDEEKIAVSSELHILLFQAVRELLVNSIKHAEAGRIRLALRRTEGRVWIDVSDDGVGFDPKTLAVRSKEGSGFGLYNIRERLADFGARLEIDSTPGEGTRIAIEVDLARKRERAVSVIHREESV